MKVAVFHPKLADVLVDALAARLEGEGLTFLPCRDEDEARAALAEAQVLVSGPGFPVHLLSRAPGLRWIQTTSAGVELWVPAVPPGVRLSRLTGSFGPRMAEYVLGYALAVTQRIPEVLANQRARMWSKLELEVLAGKTMGVAGLGSVGAAVARLCAAVGMRVIGFSRSRPDLDGLAAWYGPDQWHRFLVESDFVALTLPVTKETHHIVDEQAIRAMRPGAWLINVGRGALVDEAALIAGLRAGHPAGAVLDVFETEPLPADSPLWTLPNVIITPHHSGTTLPAEAVDIFVTNLPRFRSGKPLVNEVDLARGY